MWKSPRLALLPATFLATLALAACAPVDETIDPNGTSAEDIVARRAAADRRANEALDAMLTHFWNGGARYFEYTANGAVDTNQYWIFAQAFDAVLDGVQRTHGARYRDWVRRLYDAQAAHGFRRDWFDDENWMALALIRAFDLTNDRTYLDQAGQLLNDIRDHAQDWTCCGEHRGGLWWDRSHDSKVTASNAGPVITAVRMHARTGNAEDLAFAERVYAHWYTYMVDHETGAVTDGIARDGEMHDWRFSYNEGLMIGASVALYHATHEARYLAHAHLIAHHLITAETEQTPQGRVLSDGPESRCHNDCGAFKGIALRYLMALYNTDPSHTEYRDVIVASANAIWQNARNRELNVFGVDWKGPEAGAHPTLGEEASAVMSLQLEARLLDEEAAAGH